MSQWFQKKEPVNNDLKILIEEIRSILFPPMEIQEQNEQKFYIDYSADANIAAAIIDLEEGHLDDTTLDSLKDIEKRLSRIKQMIGVKEQILNTDAEYYVVASQK